MPPPATLRCQGAAVVAATGSEAGLGRIAGLLRQQGREETPLQKRLAELGRILIVLCLSIAGIIPLLRGSEAGEEGTRANCCTL